MNAVLERPLAAMSLAVVGAPFPNKDGSNRKSEILMSHPGEPVDLRPEPRNKADERAVAVFSSRRVQIGYLTAERAPRIGQLLRSGREIRAVFQAASDFGAWIRVAFDGEEPRLPDDEGASVTAEPPGGWFPDEVWPDD